MVAVSPCLRGFYRVCAASWFRVGFPPARLGDVATFDVRVASRLPASSSGPGRRTVISSRALAARYNLRRRRHLIVVSVVALAVFIVSHPLHAWISRPAALGLFTSPVFLVCAALLGIMCTLAYFISRSLWLPVLLHWITVVVWIMFLGGHGLIGTPGAS